jgi:hypothetical protein
VVRPLYSLVRRCVLDWRGEFFALDATESQRPLDAFTKSPFAMPDVGLFTATEPLPKNAKVVIRYVVEVEGLPVYTETYDAEKIAARA